MNKDSDLSLRPIDTGLNSQSLSLGDISKRLEELLLLLVQKHLAQNVVNIRHDNLSKQITSTFEKFHQTDADVAKKVNVLTFLTQILAQNLDDRVNLQIYGSTVNGLGLRDSDFDLVLNLAYSQRKRSNISTLWFMRSILRNYEEVQRLAVIPSRAVPILRLQYNDAYEGIEVDVDLSLVGPDAIRASKLILWYTECKYLVLTISSSVINNKF